MTAINHRPRSAVPLGIVAASFDWGNLARGEDEQVWSLRLHHWSWDAIARDLLRQRRNVKAGRPVQA